MTLNVWSTSLEVIVKTQRAQSISEEFIVLERNTINIKGIRYLQLTEAESGRRVASARANRRDGAFHRAIPEQEEALSIV